jgi:uncharacterized protein YjbJ (UPF0337 family)
LNKKKSRKYARQQRPGKGAVTPSNLIARREGKIMKPSTQDRIEGKVHEVNGKIKEEVGKATNDSDLEVSGKAEQKAGKVQEWISRAEKAVGE